ncbi:hypothetical protein BJP62_13030 [Jeongeupia sp. USM3]|nr:hypothetical protein BJP62_13030 [Jeongeupia sp. USM3]
MLRAELCVLALLLVLGIALVVVVARSRDAATTAFEQVRAARGAAQARVGEARAQLDHLAGHQRDYQMLRRRGVIGGEHRLEWVEYLDAEARRHRGLDYRIGARAAVAGVAARDGLQLYASRLDVRFAAGDETAWSAFNAGLRRLPGWPVESRCRIGRGDAGLEIDCSYDWLSIDRAESGVAE